MPPVNASLYLPWLEDSEWCDIRGAPQDYNVWILGLTTDERIVVCRYQPRNKFERKAPIVGGSGVFIGTAWGNGEDQFRLIKWKPFDFPEPPIKLTFWQKLVVLVRKGKWYGFR